MRFWRHRRPIPGRIPESGKRCPGDARSASIVTSAVGCVLPTIRRTISTSPPPSTSLKIDCSRTVSRSNSISTAAKGEYYCLRCSFVGDEAEVQRLNAEFRSKYLLRSTRLDIG
jgi:hypothetical protein